MLNSRFLITEFMHFCDLIKIFLMSLMKINHEILRVVSIPNYTPVVLLPKKLGVLSLKIMTSCAITVKTQVSEASLRTTSR